MSKTLISRIIRAIGLFGFLFLLMISVFTSCDPAIGYEYYLNNKSGKELRVYYIGFNNTTKTLIVSPKTDILFFKTEVWGKNPHDEKDDFLNMFDTLSITATDFTKLKLDYLKRDSWSYSNDIGHLGIIKTGTNIYKLEILDEDFEKK
jgi:hypothetical protein